jgi:peptidoglycan/xylan/chitin deacetylase (PgdA/CDA1 family)
MLFTTSWDDGYLLDLRIAKLLERHGLTGTFYASPLHQHGERMLQPEDLRALAARHEIGGHTLTHPRLTDCTREEAEHEIQAGKAWAEDRSGKPCAMFCYPYGDVNDAIATLVKEAGFRGARTTKQLADRASDPFRLPTTLQISPFPVRTRFTRLRHVIDPLGPFRVKRKKLKELGVRLRDCRSWYALAMALFRRMKERDAPFFHLWGHSHEIERYGMWEDLDRFLRYVAEQKTEAVTNGELIARLF